jgi:hypothetical protein
MDPATMAMLASVASSVIGGQSQARAQKKAGKQNRDFFNQRQSLINELLASIGGGGGRFAGLFNSDEGAFQRSFVDPAKSMFKNQLAPQIQQGSIAGGMQRSSGLDDQLMRAGVDLDQMLNQNYMKFQGQGQDRASSMLSQILGLGAPSVQTAAQTGGSMMGEGMSGIFQSMGGEGGAPNIFESLFSSGSSDSSDSGGSTAPMSQSQIDILNKPELMGLDASRSARHGFTP